MYFNTLIIMNEDTTGYGKRLKSPSGYCKVSMPNRVICYVQELKKLPKGQNYKLYLTSKNKKQAVEVGMFQVAMNGSKETRWTINPKNINNSSINAKDVDGALIVVNDNKAKEKTVPLVGFSEEPYNWASLISSRKEKIKPSLPVQKEVNLEKVDVRPEEPVVESCKVKCEELELVRNQIEELLNKVKTIEEKLQKDNKNGNKEYTNNRNVKKDNSKAINDYIDGFLSRLETKKPDIKKQDIKKSPKDDNKLMDKLFTQRIPINPFETPKDSIEWVRITNKDLSSLPNLSFEWLNESIITNSYDEFKHFILGRDEMKMQYYLGIPDIFDADKRSNLEIDKIESFNCCRDIPAKSGEAGYWLVRL